MGNNTGPGPQFGNKSYNGPTYKANNNFRTNGGYKGKSFNSGGSSGFQANNTRQSGSNTWFGNTDTKSNVVIECQICNKRGHTAMNCFRRNTTTTSPGFMVECQICGKRGYSALECYHRGNYAYQGQQPPPSFNAMAAQQSTEFIPHDAWMVDSGASHHITADVNSLNQVAPFEGQEDKGKSVPRIEYAETTVSNSCGQEFKGKTVYNSEFLRFSWTDDKVKSLASKNGSSHK